MRRQSIVLWALVLLIGGSGVLHFVSPGFYRRIVPRVVGHPDQVVALSGAAELVCAAAMAFPRTRRVGGWLTAALLVAVFPANFQMALDGGVPGAGFPMGNPVVAWLRLPLQVPLVMMAVSVARSR
ncbi:MAG: hypothetical protein M3010_09005 [Candidatus Dormibacteraeota bacterium]|nr:hypothetical protein [Candidatus Dormibacteraeota bacterium]